MNQTLDHVSVHSRQPSFGSQSSLSPLTFATLHDPRSSSTQSLVPSSFGNEKDGRRKLLIIYIHGFMGSDASFQSFPAHVHRYLKIALAETHVIHSKIYPRYKTYKALDVARDNFSKWLAPHESPNTDVVLVGHSMGGLLAAEIALMPSRNQHSGSYFLHRILGTVNLDAPFLGLHASVITAGIASLFRPKPDVADPPEEPIPDDETIHSLYNVPSESTSLYSGPSAASQFSLSTPGSPGSIVPYGMTFDPNFNPAFPNDARVQDRGWWRNIVHFVDKHNAEGLIDAASNHIMSYLEYGGCLVDGKGLKTRYNNIRGLEDMDDLKNHGFPHIPPQVRFVQYYTICHGYPKQPKQPKQSQRRNSNHGSESSRLPRETCSGSTTPRISIQSHSGPPSPLSLMSAVAEEDTLSQGAFTTQSKNSGLALLDPEPISEEAEPAPGSSVVDESSDNVEHSISENSQPATGPPDNGISTLPDLQEGHEGASPHRSSENDAATADITRAVVSLGLDLPAIPELPTKPELPDLEQYADKNARKQAEREGKRIQKEYAKLVKDRERAIRERQKTFDKRKKKLAQETEKQEKEEKKRRKKEEALAAAAAAAAQTNSGLEEVTPTDAVLSPQASQPGCDANAISPTPKPPGDSRNKGKTSKPPKERKFCNIHKVDGGVDPKWVQIFIKDTDQVGAHTGLFFKGEHYEKLVGDVGDTVLKWVQDDMTKRAILDMGPEVD